MRLKYSFSILIHDMRAIHYVILGKQFQLCCHP